MIIPDNLCGPGSFSWHAPRAKRRLPWWCKNSAHGQQRQPGPCLTVPACPSPQPRLWIWDSPSQHSHPCEAVLWKKHVNMYLPLIVSALAPWLIHTPRLECSGPSFHKGDLRIRNFLIITWWLLVLSAVTDHLSTVC